MTTVAGGKALVIGSSPTARQAIQRLLSGSLYSPHFVANLVELRAAINNQELVLILIDLDADPEQQLQICRALKSNVETVLLPVLALSRFVQHRLTAFEAGVDECLLLPVKPEHFQARIRALLRLSATRRQLTGEQLALEVARREHLRSTFRRYVSPQLADEIMARLEARGFEPLNVAWNTRTRAAVLFADMRGFTAMAERMNPSEVFDLLNEFFALLTEIVFKNDGTVFHMAGDCLMAGFGVPIQQTDSAQRAIKTAREMLASFGGLAQQWDQRYRLETGLGIGINEGEVVAGNVGSPNYMNYTLIGDTVNIASRLSQRARAGEVLFSNAFKITLDARGLDVGAVELPPLTLRGRANPIDIYCVPTEGRTDFRH